MSTSYEQGKLVASGTRVFNGFYILPGEEKSQRPEKLAYTMR